MNEKDKIMSEVTRPRHTNNWKVECGNIFFNEEITERNSLSKTDKQTNI